MASKIKTMRVLPKVITREYLLKLGACGDGVAEFDRLYPNNHCVVDANTLEHFSSPSSEWLIRKLFSSKYLNYLDREVSKTVVAYDDMSNAIRLINSLKPNTFDYVAKENLRRLRVNLYGKKYRELAFLIATKRLKPPVNIT